MAKGVKPLMSGGATLNNSMSISISDGRVEFGGTML